MSSERVTRSKYFASQKANDSTDLLASRYSLRRTTTRKALSTAAVVTLAAAATTRGRSITVAASAAFGNQSSPSQKGTATPSRKKRPPVVPVTPDDGQVLSSSSSSSSRKKKRSDSTTRVEKKNPKSAPRTESFSALWSGSFPDDADMGGIQPHTLILGTHPSITSLERQQYYGHPMNAFWWIAGDCLGFRRDTGISASSGAPYKFTPALRYDASHILSYEDQMRCMVSNGFAMWDVVESCHRPGSLDQDIFDEKPNRIREFCDQMGSIRRIVLANGGTGSKLLVKHFGDWMGSGELVAAENDESQKAFAKAIERAQKRKRKEKEDEASPSVVSSQPIILISALSVSPAAARYKYEQKRDFWDELVYQPGLADHRERLSASSFKKDL